MSRLRRLVLSDRFFFITCRLLPHRGMLQEPELECLARVVRERRDKHHFLLTAWVFLPDHWHLNPVRAGLAKRAEDWPWSSVHDYSGSLSAAVSANRILAVDRILVAADERTHICRKSLRPVSRVKTLRRALALTQEEFAARYHIPLATLRDRERGRSEPDQPAKAYLTVIARDPEGVERALQPVPG